MGKRIVFSVLGVLLLGYIVAAPYVTAHQMKAAARNHDGEAFSEHVDFPSVRQSIKDQANAAFMAELASDETSCSAFAAMGAAIAGMVVDKIVEAYITPAGLSRLMSGEDVDPSDEGKASDEYGSSPFEDASMSYESLSKFAVTVQAGSDGEAKFILRRRGIGWKLTEILLPLGN